MCAYQDVIKKLLLVIDFVTQIRMLRVISNIKSWFDFDVLNAIPNHAKHHKNSNDQARKFQKQV